MEGSSVIYGIAMFCGSVDILLPVPVHMFTRHWKEVTY